MGLSCHGKFIIKVKVFLVVYDAHMLAYVRLFLYTVKPLLSGNDVSRYPAVSGQWPVPRSILVLYDTPSTMRNPEKLSLSLNFLIAEVLLYTVLKDEHMNMVYQQIHR